MVNKHTLENKHCSSEQGLTEIKKKQQKTKKKKKKHEKKKQKKKTNKKKNNKTNKQKTTTKKNKQKKTKLKKKQNKDNSHIPVLYKHIYGIYVSWHLKILQECSSQKQNQNKNKKNNQQKWFQDYTQITSISSDPDFCQVILKLVL